MAFINKSSSFLNLFDTEQSKNICSSVSILRLQWIQILFCAIFILNLMYLHVEMRISPSDRIFQHVLQPVNNGTTHRLAQIMKCSDYLKKCSDFLKKYKMFCSLAAELQPFCHWGISNLYWNWTNLKLLEILWQLSSTNTQSMDEFPRLLFQAFNGARSLGQLNIFVLARISRPLTGLELLSKNLKVVFSSTWVVPL